MKVKSMERVVVRFSGDSGDGMQLVGSVFSNVSALIGNQISTFPDYPAEIRAPQGSLSGVSGFQVHVGVDVHTPGDQADMLVAMNPAALKTNIKYLKAGGVVICDSDRFKATELQKAQYSTADPIAELGIDEKQVLLVPMTTLLKSALADSGLDNKSMMKCKNMLALGIVCWLFDRPVEKVLAKLKRKFINNHEIYVANEKAVRAGWDFGSNTHSTVSTYRIDTEKTSEKGLYTDVNGNTATAWGLIKASEKSGCPLFLASYPITPATDILHELAKRKDLGVKACQMEDEISGVCTAVGAAYAGNLAVTSTSGPGLSLKSEGIGLAVMAELPLVIIDVQRGGPSTGLPTKTEQTDLMQALYGRNGESPICVLAASSPTDCFTMAFEAGRIALEYMTPVILLTDAFIANGSSAWRIPEDDEFPEIRPNYVDTDRLNRGWKPYDRNDEYVRYWAVPGMPNAMHRVGGLEKDEKTSAISTDGVNHGRMVELRYKKIENIAKHIPLLEIAGKKESATIVVGWGGTYGHLLTAVDELNKVGVDVAFAHFRYINPLPANALEELSKYDHIIVAELNTGQFADYLQAKLPAKMIQRINKVEGQPFMVKEIVDGIKRCVKCN